MPDALALIIAIGSTVVHRGQNWKIESLSQGKAVITRRSKMPVEMDLGELVAAQPQEHRTAAARRLRYAQSFTTFDMMPADVQSAAADRAGHIRELETGYRSGTAAVALAHEPRDEYNPSLVPQLGKRQSAKATELGISQRSVRAWCDEFRKGGETALTRQSRFRPRVSFPSVDPRLIAEVRAIVAEAKSETRPVTSVLIAAAFANLPDVPRPSMPTMYRLVNECQSGSGMQAGISKTRASINARPSKRNNHRHLIYPGQVVQLDTTVLDVFCVDPDGGQPFRPELTVAIDQYTRCILAMVIARTTTSAHVASLIAEILQPKPLDPAWPGNPVWPYHGVPGAVLYTAHDEQQPRFGPVVTPETIVVDNGKVFTGKELKRLAALIGFSLEPTRPASGFSKAQVERFFGTMTRGALAPLRGYVGGGTESTLGDPASQAFFTPTEVLEYLRQWVATVYHLTPQKDLYPPNNEFGGRSPFQMYDVGIATSGFVRAPADVNLRFQILPSQLRDIRHGPIRLNNRKYNAPVLRDFAGRKSAYPGGKWPIHWDTNDIKTVWLQDDDHNFHPVPWTEGVDLPAPFSDIARKIVDEQRRSVLSDLQTRTEGQADLLKFNRYVTDSVYPSPKPKKAKRAPTKRHVEAAANFTTAKGKSVVETLQHSGVGKEEQPLPPGFDQVAGYQTGSKT